MLLSTFQDDHDKRRISRRFDAIAGKHNVTIYQEMECSRYELAGWPLLKFASQDLLFWLFNNPAV